MAEKSNPRRVKGKVARASKVTVSADDAKDIAIAAEAVRDADNYVAPSFSYKPSGQYTKLFPNEATFTLLRNAAARKCTKKEIAALLGVKNSSLHSFMLRNPEAKEAWEQGRQLRKTHIRKLLDDAAEKDYATLRFLAKNELGMTDGPSSKTSVDVTVTQNNGDQDERLRKILALQEKVIDGTAREIKDNTQVEDLTEIFNSED